MATVADHIIAQLRAAGVRTLFGVPGGGSNLDLIEASGIAGLPFVLTSTETGGAIAAMAQAEVTGHVGACLTTLGPGAASVVNGVACAFLDRAPMVVFTDSHPGSARACTHQRIDHGALFTPVTKSSETLTAANAVGAVTCALHAVTDGTPGPAHLDCPGDVARALLAAHANARGRRDADIAEPPPGSLTPSPIERRRFDALLAGARKPLLLVGLGARRPEDAAAIRGLCERRHVPALVTYKAKGVVPDDHPWFAGVFTNASIEQAIINESDLLIGVGLDPVELIPRQWTYSQPIVYSGPWQVDDAHVPFAGQLITDVPSGVQQIEWALATSHWDVARVRQHVDEQRRGACIAADGLTAQQVVEIAAARLAFVAGRVTVDAGAHMFPVTMLWPVTEPNGMLISNGLSTMGFALPAAIGAALIDPGRPVVALTGDGGLLMCVGELLTAVREKLRIIVIVFSDASLSLIEIKQQARQLKPAGVALGDVDWPALAASFGLTGVRASTKGELEHAIDRALACDGPSLIEARIDRSNYAATLKAIRG
jgi:acetolactate synthase-1/2/3 large subunit